VTKILIVEDSKTYNTTLMSLLRSPNYEIHQAYSLKEAKEFLRTTKIDYIILDLNLPDGTGDDLILYLNKKTLESKIIVLTANQDIQRRNFLFEHGVIDYYSKDIPIKMIAKDLKKLVNDLEKNLERNILVVDDSKFVLDTVSNILQVKNYNIKTAINPIEALELLKNGLKCNLIFLDLEMPKMSGIEFLERIKKVDYYKNIPVIILSSSEDRQKYTRVLKHGAIDFIRKPFLTEEILLKADLHISQADYLKQIATQAKELEEYKRVLNESDMVSKTTAHGIIKEANDKFCEISGYSQEFLIGKSHKVIRHPDMPKKVFKEL